MQRHFGREVRNWWDRLSSGLRRNRHLRRLKGGRIRIRIRMREGRKFSSSSPSSSMTRTELTDHELQTPVYFKLPHAFGGYPGYTLWWLQAMAASSFLVGLVLGLGEPLWQELTCSKIHRRSLVDDITRIPRTRHQQGPIASDSSGYKVALPAKHGSPVLWSTRTGTAE